jgi:hypothetical protein
VEVGEPGNLNDIVCNKRNKFQGAPKNPNNDHVTGSVIAVRSIVIPVVGFGQAWPSGKVRAL